MMLVEQIKAIHAKHFNKEFHEYRGDIIPAMVNDLKMKFFDDLDLDHTQGYNGVWYLLNTQEIRAVREASKLIQATGLRENTPAVQ